MMSNFLAKIRQMDGRTKLDLDLTVRDFQLKYVVDTYETLGGIICITNNARCKQKLQSVEKNQLGTKPTRMTTK